MALSLSTAANVLKNFYLPKIQEQLNQKSVIYDRLKKFQETVDGKNYTYALHTSRNSSAGTGMSDGGAFPTAGNQGYSTAVVPEAQIAVSLEITGRAIKSTKTDAGAYIRAIKSEVDGAQKDFVRAINRQLNSDGTDALAFWTSADDTSGTVVDDGGAHEASAGVSTYGNAFVHLAQGANTCDLIDATDNSSLLGTAIVVTLGAENASTFSVTWSGTVSGSADGDYLVMSGTLGKQLMGIRGVISSLDPPLLSGGLQGLPVSTNAFWKAQDFSGSGTLRDLTLELMQKPLSRISRQSNYSEDDVEFLLSNTGFKDKYIALLVADKRHVNTMTLDGGQTSVDFNGKPLIVDPQARENVCYYIVPDSMDVLTSSNGAVWADFADGSMWQKKPSTNTYADAYLAFLVFYGQLAIKARNANGILRDVTI